MKAPSTALLRAFSPLWRADAAASSSCWTARGCLSLQRQQTANFSATEARLKRERPKKTARERRVNEIRYHLSHALTPRPLRLSRLRSLRHWTIHRAWQLYQSKLRRGRERELERQYNSMYAACEALRATDGRGLTAAEAERIGAPPAEEKDVGRLYRIAMLKKGIWDGVPIEYARIQTETPSRTGWNDSWTR